MRRRRAARRTRSERQNLADRLVHPSAGLRLDDVEPDVAGVEVSDELGQRTDVWFYRDVAGLEQLLDQGYGRQGRGRQPAW